MGAWLASIGAALLALFGGAASVAASAAGQMVSAVFAVWARMVYRTVALMVGCGILAILMYYAFNELVAAGANFAVSVDLMTPEQLQFFQFIAYFLGLDVVIPMLIVSLPIRFVLNRVTLPLM